MSTAVVIAGDDKMRSLLRAGVGAVAAEVIEASEPEGLPAECAAELAVVVVGDDVRAGIRRALARLAPDGELVVVGDLPAAGAIDALQAEPRVVAVLAAARATPAAMAALARRLTGHGFGLASWLPAGTVIQHAEVASYADKVRCIDQLQRAAEAALIGGKYRDAIAECADELMMNALYGAPRAAAAGAQASKQSMAERLARTVRVEWARAGDWFHVAVRDGWGALHREALLDSWSGALAAGSRADQGSGLGMAIVGASSTGIHFTVAPGVATECVCSFDTRQTKLHLQEVGLVRETDTVRLAELRRRLRPPAPAPARPAVPSATRVLLATLILIVVVLLLALALR